VRSALLTLLLALPLAGAANPALELDWQAAPDNLLQALSEVSAQSGLRILHPAGSALLESLPAPALAAGRYPLATLLDALFAGSGLHWRLDGEGDIVIETRPRLDARTVVVSDRPLDDEVPIRPGARAAEMPGTTPWRAAELGDWPTLNWQQLLRYAPNVAGQGATLNLRGVGLGRGPATAASVYLDGMPLPLSVIDADAVPLLGLDAVEFRRGPRSPWEGASTLGGSIDLRTVAPSTDRSLGGAVSAGSGSQWRGWLQADSGIGTHGIGARLSVEHSDGGGFNDHVLRPERGLDRQQISSALLKLSFEPDRIEALSVGARLLGISADPGQPLIAPASLAQTDFDPFQRLTFDPFDYSQRLRSGAGALDVDWRPDGRWQAWAHATYGHANERTELVLAALPSERQRSSERESRGLLSIGSAWTPRPGWRLSLGAEAERRRFDAAEASLSDVRDFFPPALVVDVDPSSDRIIEGRVITRITSNSLSLDARRDSEAWTLEGGLRLLDERLNQTQSLQSFLTEPGCIISIGVLQIPCAEEFPARGLSEDSRSTSTIRLPHGRVEFRPASGHRIAFGYRRGYLSGGTQFNLISGDFEVYAPERSATLDLAWHWEFGRFESALTVFANRWRDRQIPIALPQAGSFLIGNAGRASAHGAEWVLRGALSDGLRGHLGVGYLDTRFDSFALAQGFDVVELAGKRFPEAPKHTAVAGIDWRHGDGWHAGLGVRYSSGVFSDPANRAVGYRGGHVVLDAVVGWRDQRRHLFLAVDNLGDRRYLRGLQLVAGQPNPRFYRPAEPRTLRLGLQIDW
jgi:iron complex outermembrane recepter protein